MIKLTPTDAELSEAYKVAELQRIGVSFQKAIETESIRIALKISAIALRKRSLANDQSNQQMKIDF